MRIDQQTTVLKLHSVQLGALTVPNADSLLLDGPLTIEAWIRAIAVDGRRAIAGHGNAGWEFGIQDDHLYFSMGGEQQCVHAVPVPVWKWTHVAATLARADSDECEITLLVNGSAKHFPKCRSPEISSAGFAIGGRTDGSGPFVGYFARIALWRSAKSANQIIGARFLGPAGHEPDLAALWKLDTDEGASASDSSSALHHAVLPERANFESADGSGLDLLEPVAKRTGASAQFMHRAKEHIANRKAETLRLNADKLATARMTAGAMVTRAHASAAKMLALSKFDYVYYEGRDGVRRINPAGETETILSNAIGDGFIPGTLTISAGEKGTELFVASKSVPSAIRIRNANGACSDFKVGFGDSAISSIAVDDKGNLFWISGSRYLVTMPASRRESEMIRNIANIAVASESGDWPLAIDADRSNLYWGNSEGIWRKPSSGHAPDGLAGELDLELELVVPVVDAGNPIAMDVDGEFSRIYWISRMEGSHWLRRASLDGDNVENLYELDDPGRGVAVDPESEQIFWTDKFQCAPPVTTFPLSRPPVDSGEDTEQSMTVFGEPSWVVPKKHPDDEKIRTVVELNGVDEYLEARYSPAINSAHFTFSVWVFVTGGNGTRCTVFANIDNDPARGFALYAEHNDEWEFWVGAGPRKFVSANGPPVINNTWTHLVGTYDGASMSIFRNGERYASIDDVELHPNLHRPLRIGASCFEEGVPQAFFAGQIAELQFWDRVLSDEEIAGQTSADERYLYRGAPDGSRPPEPLHKIDTRGAIRLASKTLTGHAQAIIQKEKLRVEKEKAARDLRNAHIQADNTRAAAHDQAATKRETAKQTVADAKSAATGERAIAQRRLAAKRKDAETQKANARGAANARRAAGQQQAEQVIANSTRHAQTMEDAAQRDLDNAHRQRAKY